MAKIDELYGILPDFQIDIGKLKEAYKRIVEPIKPVRYSDQGVGYDGWAVTSPDGKMESGVRYCQQNVKPMTIKTEVCKDEIDNVVERLFLKNLAPSRIRIMRLKSEGYEMPFHTDPTNATTKTYRLQIPIITNPNAFFEWKVGEKIHSVHFPADGFARWIRVDVLHRVVNRSIEPNERVHMLMNIQGRFLQKH